MDLIDRIILAAAALAILVGYAAWRWHRAGQYVAAQEAHRDAAREYREAMKRDSRWHALEAHVKQRYPLTDEHTDPGAFVVHHIAVVDDRGQMCRPENTAAPTRVVAMIVRQQPPTQLYVSMDLRTGELREDPAPHGWTYFGPYL